MEKKRTVQQVQGELAQLKRGIAERIEDVEAVRALLPVDIDTVPVEMLTWEVCPTLELGVHHLLSHALSSFQEGLECLGDAEVLTLETLQKRWAEIQAAGLP
jgi:hypothetical protein